MTIRCVFLGSHSFNSSSRYISDWGDKGAFLSPLVSTCLAVHLKKAILNIKQYGYPVGGLAIATAVVCALHFGSR